MNNIGVDVGRTFTDLILCELLKGSILTHKISTTPEDSSIGVMNGITDICLFNGVDSNQKKSRLSGNHDGDQPAEERTMSSHATQGETSCAP